ncbi:hypothetical protein OO013_17150 [Mangrovivirga sp. M17]|uniref:Membrane associated rhomboid family serine protease n=1 Tax=Mangrovivirga halotolerans TaxID=2993936 RepID=A0ABT3RWK4_9BACT|nr:hypothetical protein [Mangrovivirga halotolerans]MCX2745612.1 hypothetical protein [Mangrovivirga halotolerans]
MPEFKEFRKSWIKATTFGYMVFLLMIPNSLIILTFFRPPALEGLTIAEILQQASTTSPFAYGKSFYIILQAGHFIHYLIVGAVLAVLQYNVLKEHIRNKFVWIILTIAGLEVILLGDLVYTGLSTGGAPGPLEPLLIGLGGGSFIAILQYLYLRSVGIKNGKWVGWWVLGIIIGILSSALFIFIYEFFLNEFVKQNFSALIYVLLSWLAFILPYFTLIGFFAGLLSAKPLYKAIEKSSYISA